MYIKIETKSNSTIEIEIGSASDGGTDDPIERELVRLIPELRTSARF